MNRVVLAIILPLASAAMVATIGISFGILFLQLHHHISSEATLAAATGLTAAIMAVAALLHMRTRGPGEPADTTGVPMKGDRVDRPGQPWEKGPTDPAIQGRDGRRSSRSNDRKRSR
jgi:hypothetical protein